ncbi:MAG: outer membrane beta-barrel protein, partial [Pseudomonadota bacterium]
MSLMARGIVVAGVALGVAGTANAQLAEGWYAGAEAGAAVTGDATTSGGGQRWSTDYSAGPVVMGTAGYGFGPGKLGRLRLEGEVGWRNGEVDGVNGASGSGDASATSLMANVVTDFLPQERVHPFVGLGVGGALVDSSASAAGSGFSGDDTVFAYQAIAGVGFDVTREVGLSLAYRYFATQDPSLSTSSGASAESEYASHAVTAGITFRFGAPAPAPAPALAPAAA